MPVFIQRSTHVTRKLVKGCVVILYVAEKNIWGVLFLILQKCSTDDPASFISVWTFMWVLDNIIFVILLLSYNSSGTLKMSRWIISVCFLELLTLLDNDFVKFFFNKFDSGLSCCSLSVFVFCSNAHTSPSGTNIYVTNKDLHSAAATGLAE